MSVSRGFRWLHELLHRPLQIFWICAVIGLSGLILDGTAFRLWSLKRDHRVLGERIGQAKVRSKQLEFKIQKSQELGFIERAARDQFDLVKEGDLIFIFSDESPEIASGGEGPEKTTGIKY